MTKLVRIENADNSDLILVVEIWEKDLDGNSVLVETRELPYPTALEHITIWSNRWLVVKERAKHVGEK